MTEQVDLDRLDAELLLLRRRSWERANNNTRVNWWLVLSSTLVLSTGTVFGWYAGKAAMAVWRYLH